MGKSWDRPESPNCSGLTPSESAAIDSSTLDLPELMAETAASVGIPNSTGMQQNTQGGVQQKMQNYYQRGGQ